MEFDRVIIKLGTSTLTGGTSRLSTPQLIEIVRQCSALHSDGRQIVVTSSGAMAAGREVLEFPELPKFVPAKQMLSAVGQPRLMTLYSELFSYYGKTVAQVLLTRSDLSDRRRYLNARNTLEALLSHRIIPIINENDTVATEEIRLGDNDNLSALAANLIEADLLVLLTDQEGLLTGDPHRDKGATLVKEVTGTDIPDSLWQAAGGSKTSLGTGGMLTKLRAADLARRSGTKVVIARGSDPDVLSRIANGEIIGTTLHPVISTMESRKRYMLAGGRASDGRLFVDNGAARALNKGGSLLPVGIISVSGFFERGDAVHIVNPEGRDLAMGLVNYASKDLELIHGKQSNRIEPLLGYTFGDEVIHHNNMLLL
jgi:glutamate 5-kinase